MTNTKRISNIDKLRNDITLKIDKYNQEIVKLKAKILELTDVLETINIIYKRK